MFPPQREKVDTIDGTPVTNSDGIANIFADRFQKDFNAIDCSVDENQLNLMLGRNETFSKSDCWSQGNVAAAIRELNPNKAPGADEMGCELLLHSSDMLSVHLSLLFRACESHGYLPEALSEGVLYPVPKVNKAGTNSGNYRPITISTAISKVFEKCILKEYNAQLSSSSRQFGFKPGHSTAHCTAVVKSVAKHYLQAQGKVYSVLLDASKAFDYSNFFKIFQILLGKGIPSSVVNLLKIWYTNSQTRVSFAGSRSRAFGAKHGVRQGGHLSPTLFAILYDTLLQELKRSNLGCQINGVYCGSFAYADDLVLLAPSYSALKKMLKICESWSNRNNIHFNGAKSQCMVFRAPKAVANIDPPKLGDVMIPIVDQATHLGHIINYSLDDSEELKRMSKNFNKQFHSAYYRFHRLNNPSIFLNLIQTYCTSFYGIELVNMDNVSSASRKLLSKSVNLAYMRALQLPPESVSKYLIAEGLLNANATQRYRSATFWSQFLRNETFVYRGIIEEAHHEIIVATADYLRILPASLRFLSSCHLHQLVVERWGEAKGVFS